MGGEIMRFRKSTVSGKFFICFFLLTFIFILPDTVTTRAFGQPVVQNQPRASATYTSEQFQISFDYPDGCTHEDKKGFLRNMQVVKISCSDDGNMEQAFINLVTDNFMPAYNFKQAVEYILGYGYSADGVTESQYPSPFVFDQFTNTAGMKGYKVTYSIVKETYTDKDTIRKTTPHKAVVYDLSQNNEIGLRAVLFKTSTDYLEQVADTFGIIE
jgi:hypothetical protein